MGSWWCGGLGNGELVIRGLGGLGTQCYGAYCYGEWGAGGMGVWCHGDMVLWDLVLWGMGSWWHGNLVL